MFEMTSLTSLLAFTFGDTWWIWLILMIVLSIMGIRNSIKTPLNILNSFAKDVGEELGADETVGGLFKGFAKTARNHLMFFGGAGICFIVMVIAVAFKLFGGK